MLEINPITLNAQTFQARPTSYKFSSQKLQRALGDKRLPELAKKNLAQDHVVLTTTAPMTELKSEIITELGILNAKLAPKEYATTSAKLAEQKGRNLSKLL